MDLIVLITYMSRTCMILISTSMSFQANHSLRLRETPSRPWVITEQDGKIIAAHCNCMAGLAESCSHVDALLFAIEAAVKIRNSATVTQSKAYWLMPSGVNKVDYLEVDDINFTSLKTRKNSWTDVLPLDKMCSHHQAVRNWQSMHQRLQLVS